MKKLVIMVALLCVLPNTVLADEVIRNLLDWDKVVAIKNKGKFLMIFKNPAIAEIKYVVVGVTSNCISHYIIVGETVQLFINKRGRGVFEEKATTDKAKKKMWLWLQHSIGLFKM